MRRSSVARHNGTTRRASKVYRRRQARAMSERLVKQKKFNARHGIKKKMR